MPLSNLYSNVCRTCLTQNYYMKSVFNTEEFMESSAMLYQMLTACASVQVYAYAIWFSEAKLVILIDIILDYKRGWFTRTDMP